MLNDLKQELLVFRTQFGRLSTQKLFTALVKN